MFGEGNSYAGTDMLQVQFETRLTNFILKADIVAENKILVLFGPSGSGKTTILKMIAGLMMPQNGLIKLNGRLLFSSADRIKVKPQFRNIGFVPQDYALFPHLRVKDNIGYGIVGKVNANEYESRILQMLETVKIIHLKDRFPKQLSGGEAQRVALARALITRPALLLLDEPLSALDADLKLELQEELYGLQKQWNIPFVLVTHDYREVERLEASRARLTVADEVHKFTFSETDRPKVNTLQI